MDTVFIGSGPWSDNRLHLRGTFRKEARILRGQRGRSFPRAGVRLNTNFAPECAEKLIRVRTQGLEPYVPRKKLKPTTPDAVVELLPPDWRQRPWLQELDDEQTTCTGACLFLHHGNNVRGFMDKDRLHRLYNDWLVGVRIE